MTHDDLSEETNFWPSFSDMFLILFIVSLVCAGHLYQSNENLIKESDQQKAERQSLREQLEEATKNALEKEIQLNSYTAVIKDNTSFEDLLKKIDELENKLKVQHNKLNQYFLALESLEKLEKLIGTTSDSRENMETRLSRLAHFVSQITEKSRVVKVLVDESKIKFPINGHQVPDNVNAKQIFGDLLNELKNNPGKKYVVEVYGHTDTSKPRGITKAEGEAFNNNLGMLRAQSIKEKILDILPPSQHNQVTFHVYSAGEHIPAPTSQYWQTPTPSECRRIEVHMRRTDASR